MLQRFLALVLLLSMGQGTASAQTELVTDIVVEGNERIETSTVESYLSIRPGDPFDPFELDSSLRNLFATGLFDDVSLTREGETLVVRVVENPIINRIAFEGNRRLDDEQLEAEVQLRPRVVFTQARAQTAVMRILELYRRSGHYAARVEPKIIRLDENRVDLVFEIEEGPPTKVSGVTFIGNREFSDSTLRGVIETKEQAWYRFFSTVDTYDPDRLAFDQELLRRFYLDRGYAEFGVVSAIAELTPDGRDFFITMTVDEGDLYRFGDIGVEVLLRDLDAQEVEGLIESEPGDVYSAQEVEDTIDRITDRVGELGYAFGQVEPILDIDRQTLTIDLTYLIEQSQRVYVERIDIKGNVRTLDSVIRREFRIAEGDAYNVALLRRSQQRIRNLGYFETVNVTTDQGSAPDKVIIDVDVTERSTGELSIGAGFSTADGPLGDIRLTERNLLGRGQTLSANVTVSGRRQEVEFGFTEPYFLGRDLAAGFDLFHTRTDFQSESSFDENSTGGRLRASYPLRERLRHAVRYTLRDDEIDNVDNGASVFIRAEEGNRITSSVGQTLTYDVRDSKFLPSEGYIIRLDQDVAGFGGDNRFLRHELRTQYFYSVVKDVVLSFKADGGYIVGFGGEDVHLSNRFFLGGSTLRGFKFGGVGPRDVSTNDSLGGNLYYVGSTELRFPLGLPDELRIFGRTFVDAGTLTDIDVSGPTLEDSGNLRVGAGVGFSWLSPIGPLSIDFAQALVKDSDDETETFRLSFGTRF